MWFVIGAIEGFIALVQIATSNDASQATVLCLLAMILGEVEGLRKGRRK